MNRRNFVALIGGALAAPLAIAQQAKVFRVGWISPDSTLGSPFFDVFLGGLRDLGYVEGRNLVMDVRWGGPSGAPLDQLAGDLVRSKPDVIVTQGGATLTLMRAGPAMPVVFGYSGDPVAAGLAASLARPGRNYTGMSFLSFELVGKRLALLKEVLPALKRVAILANPQHPGEEGELRASQAAAKALGLSLQYVELTDVTKLEAAFGAILQSRSEAVDVFPDAITMRVRERIAEFALKHRVPSISGWARFADSGNLLSYGPNLRDVYRRLAVFVDRIFKGANPADLPIELPTTVELVVNLKAAKALGIAIPQAVLVRADRVIE